MLSIRLARVGRVNLPAFRLVVQEKTQSPHAHVTETIGSYDPKVEPAKLIANKERLDYWLKAGARPTLAVAELLVKHDLIKLEQVPELTHERERRDASKKRLADKRAHKEKVAKEIKARNEAKQKAKDAPKAEAKTEAPKAEAKPAESKPADKTEKPVEKK